MQSETAIVLEVTCETDKVDMVLWAMKKACLEFNRITYRDHFDWVHVNQTTALAQHFSVKALQEQDNAS